MFVSHRSMCETPSTITRKAFCLKIEDMTKINSHSNELSGTTTFTSVWRAYRALLIQSEKGIKKTGLCDSDFRVLKALLQKSPQPVNVLGAHIDLTTGSITTAIDRLESRWLAVRKLDPNDKRVRLVELTSKGRRIIERASIEHERYMEKAFRSLSRGQRLQLVKLLERISRNSSSRDRRASR
jgi:MarR family transcriptional regulator, 2-MHQ and catechol-resistance regulon repressor